jgi:hypothetical protein
MRVLTKDIMSLFNDTPLIPMYNFGNACPPGKKRYKEGNKWLECKRNTRRSAFGKKKRSSAVPESYLKNISKHLKLKTKVLSKIKSSIIQRGKSALKSKNNKNHLYFVKQCKFLSKKLKIPHKRKSHLAVWKLISKKLTSPTKKYKKITKRYKRTIKSKRRPRGSRFGSWWDNTQQLYANACANQQCADFETLGGNYPFYNREGWVPYSPIKGNAFGNYYGNSFGNSWPPNNDLGGYPRSLMNAYPFNY